MPVEGRGLGSRTEHRILRRARFSLECAFYGSSSQIRSLHVLGCRTPAVRQ